MTPAPTRVSDAPIDARGVKAARRELLASERVVAAQRQHISRLAGPTLGLLTGLVLMLWIGLVTPASMGFFSDWALRLWLLMFLYYVYVVVSWQHDWFIATDRRLILIVGLFVRRTAMMPLQKVTDLTFERPLMGRLVGYGTFVLESAGQDQALHRLTHLRRPNATYLAICEELFGRRKQARAGEEHPSALGEQTAPAVQQPIEDTDVPLARIGSYLERTAHDSRSRSKDHKGPLRQRLLRGPQPLETFGESTSLLTERDEQSRSWAVSTEDAAQPQRVEPREDHE